MVKKASLNRLGFQKQQDKDESYRKKSKEKYHRDEI